MTGDTYTLKIRENEHAVSMDVIEFQKLVYELQTYGISAAFSQAPVGTIEFKLVAKAN